MAGSHPQYYNCVHHIYYKKKKTPMPGMNLSIYYQRTTSLYGHHTITAHQKDPLQDVPVSSQTILPTVRREEHTHTSVISLFFHKS